MRFTFFRGFDSQNSLKTTELDECKSPFKSIILEFCISYLQCNITFLSLRKNEKPVTVMWPFINIMFIYCRVHSKCETGKPKEPQMPSPCPFVS